MLQLKKTTQIVEHILRKEPKTRNSDSLLYLRVIQHHAYAIGVDLHRLPVVVFLLKMEEYGFPPFESVRRTRQKIQSKFPELSASGKVAEFRAENERVYRGYALSDKGWS